MSSGTSEKLVSLFEGIGKNMSMKEFEDRLEVQKIPYLAQEYGIDLGYAFSWYLKGPYSKQVTHDGYLIYEFLKKGENPASTSVLDEQKLSKFKEIISPYLDDSLWLEIAASLLYLKKENYSEKPLQQVIGYLIEDLTCGYKNFDEKIVRRVIADLINIEMLKD